MSPAGTSGQGRARRGRAGPDSSDRACHQVLVEPLDAFRVPDTLAGRADVWNLGEALRGKEEAFALSFVENALTSHPALAPLAGRDRTDPELLVRLAGEGPTARRERLTHPYGPTARPDVPSGHTEGPGPLRGPGP
ncbi:hypothetical protein ABZ350_00230 [Streptomyces uncialis]